MLTTALLIYLVSSVSADDNSGEKHIVPRCSDVPGTRMTFNAVDGYTGRYVAELCTERNLKLEEWELHLSFYETPDYCNASNHKKDLQPGKTHSKNVEWISNKHNCSSNQTVCMSATFDFIFSACYSMRSKFPAKDAPPQRYFYFNITNNHTKLNFSNNQAHVYPAYYNDYMTLTWFTGVPPLVYKILLCNVSQSNWDQCPQLTNCSITDKTTIECILNPQYGCYDAYLKHSAPWIQGEFYSQELVYYNFCRNATQAVAVSGSAWWQGAGAWGALGACAALVVAGGAALGLRRTMHLRKRQQKALWMWLTRRNAAAGAGAGAGAGACAGAGAESARRHVLVLYAQDGGRAARAVAALCHALQHVMDGEVYDIFSPAVLAECAPSPHGWVRARMQRADTAVLLLQAPALRQHRELSPLLAGAGAGAGAAPSFGATLLQFALQLAAESACSRDNYHKYFIATLSEAPDEVWASVVPYRRYVLPGALPLLLRDIASPRRAPPPSAALQHAHQLLHELADQARDRCDELTDEPLIDT